ncbi:hypothetical protein HDV63DRAFT_415103 [Trichoderma sp. SZMC 28014]
MHPLTILGSTAAYEHLYGVATGDMSWEEYQSGPVVHKDDINGLFYTLLQSVDILCMTPSLSCRDEFKAWKENANGIAVDEAGNMSRPDLYCVWGNTLRPCAMHILTALLPSIEHAILIGDRLQLRPQIMNYRARIPEGSSILLTPCCLKDLSSPHI